MPLRAPHDEKVLRTTTVLFAASPYSVLVLDEHVLADATGGVVLLDLPALATVRGLHFTFYKTDASASAVTIDGSGAETINGSLTNVLVSQGDAVTIFAPETGTDWKIVSYGSTVRLTPTNVSSELLWGNSSVTASTTTRFLTPGYTDGTALTVAVQWRVTREGVIRKLRMRHNSPAGNGNSIVYTLRVNGVSTLLSVSLASTGTDGSDLVNTVVVTTGDLVDIVVTKALVVGASPSNITAIVEFGP